MSTSDDHDLPIDWASDPGTERERKLREIILRLIRQKEWEIGGSGFAWTNALKGLANGGVMGSDLRDEIARAWAEIEQLLGERTRIYNAEILREAISQLG